jgi:cytoskeletal protein CcmA (bactofilin family)
MSDERKQSSTAAGGLAVIGTGMRIKGTIHSKQDLYVDGEVEGNLEVENCRLTIGPHGKAASNAKAREVDIQGAIEGRVESTEKISIRNGGRLVGDIRAAGIVIEDGAYFKGGVDIVNPRGEADDV